MAGIELKNISKIYGGSVVAVDDISLEIKDGEFMIFLGPSGCGKSTTLRMIGGLESISKGDLFMSIRPTGTSPSCSRTTLSIPT